MLALFQLDSFARKFEMDHAVKIAHEIAWPVATLVMFAFFMYNLRTIGDALRRAPLIRTIKFGGLEVEIDRNSLDELKESTDRTFLELIKKTDAEVCRFASSLGIFETIKAAAENLKTNLPEHARSQIEKAGLRVTLHISDAVFIDHLYQLSNYYYAEKSEVFWQGDTGAGRRFSIRYGIIGLAARTEKSQAVGDAFQGSLDEQQALIEHWSMLPSQAASAQKKPSCLAIILKSPDTGAVGGILYADAEIENFFGDNKSALEFAEKCLDFAAVKRLARDLGQLKIIRSQFEINFNLTSIGQK